MLVYGKHGRTGIYEMQEALRYSLPAQELLTNVERVSELRRFVQGVGKLPCTSYRYYTCVYLYTCTNTK